MRGMPAFVVEVNPGPHRRGPSPLLQSQAGRKQVGAGSGKARRRRDESRHWRWLPNPVGRKMRQRRRSGRLVGGEGRKRVGLGVLDLCRKGDDLLAAFADAAADLRTRRHGVGATATLLHGCGVMGTGQRHAPRQQRRHDDQNGPDSSAHAVAPARSTGFGPGGCCAVPAKACHGLPSFGSRRPRSSR